MSGTSWPVGKGHFRHEELALYLRDSGQAHARRALSTFVSTDVYEQQLAAISVGCAVELLSKALIAKSVPALLSERHASQDTLLHLTNLGHLAQGAPTDVKTLGAAAAMETARLLHPRLTWRPTDAVAFRVRNAAAHMALVDAAELHTAVLALLRYVESFVSVEGDAPGHFWGVALAPLAKQLVDEANNELRRVVAAKRAAAEAKLARLLEHLDEAARVAVLASLSGRKVALAQHEEPQTCPVCLQQGWLMFGVETSFDVSQDRQSVRARETALPFAFECAVCGLDVESDELNELGFSLSPIRLSSTT